MTFHLQPIPEEVTQLIHDLAQPDLKVNLELNAEFFQQVGYYPPWIGYLVCDGDSIVGNAAFKGPPQDGKIEIAYGIFDQFQQKGYGTHAAKTLVAIAQNTDPAVVITARTLPENNFSTRILKKNGFIFSGEILDPEDGIVWEWIYQSPE